MRSHRIAVGASLRGKVEEFGFFLGQLIETSKAIEHKWLKQDFPLNKETDRLNYYFSAFLNAIQSLKDSCQTAMGIAFSWAEVSPTYGSFIYYCRNATTHDGCHIINVGQGAHNYIAGPLRRINNNGNVMEFDPPQDEVATLCLKIANEVLGSVRKLIGDKGGDIPVQEEADLHAVIDVALNSKFIPDVFKEIMRDNKTEILESMSKASFDYAKSVLDAIATLEKRIADYDA